jgi:hypothetical protein
MIRLFGIGAYAYVSSAISNFGVFFDAVIALEADLVGRFAGKTRSKM